jgi:hypothetical protein
MDGFDIIEISKKKKKNLVVLPEKNKSFETSSTSRTTDSFANLIGALPRIFVATWNFAGILFITFPIDCSWFESDLFSGF